MAPVIELEGVSFRYRVGSDRWILNRLGLTVEAGEYVLLCGASGSGKSTLACLLNGLIPHLIEGELRGSIQVAGTSPSACQVADFLDRLGLVLQHADAQLFNSRVDAEIAYGLESLGRAPEEIDERLHAIARRFAIEHLLERSPDTLSGGEKRLLALAAVLVTGPPIVVLDEPFAHLDQVHAARLCQVLQQLHLSGTTLVVIEQRVEAVLPDVDRCIVLEGGRAVYAGPPREAGEMLRRRHLIPNYPVRRVLPAPAGEPVLEARGLTCRLGGQVVFRDLSFGLDAGRISALVGPVGSGKTTLIRALLGLTPLAAGEILLAGRRVNGQAPEQLAAAIGVAFQDPNDQFFTSRVEDELAAGSRALGRLDPLWMEQLCRRLDLDRLATQSPYRLSEGQKKRLSLAIALAARPRLLILDEPTVGQDGRCLEQLAGLILELADRGLAVLVATHDRNFARAVADKTISLDSVEPLPAEAAGSEAAVAG